MLAGGAAFVGALSAPGRPPESFAIVTDQGMSHPIATADDVKKLGYSTGAAWPLPSNLLRLFREGPILSSGAAVRPIPVS
jgi:hypothetical protein